MKGETLHLQVRNSTERKLDFHETSISKTIRTADGLY